MTSVFTDGTLEPRVNTASPISADDALLSIAISLKRIADALDTQTSHTAYGEPLLEGLQNSIARGLRGIEVPR